MADARCVPVKAWHVEFIAAAMREADRDEILKLNGVTPREGLDISLAQPGRHWTGLIHGAPVVIFGAVPVTTVGGAAVIWLLGTNAVTHYPRIFARFSRKVVAELLDEYDVLLNIVHADNRVALRWLQWLGATFARSDDKVYFELRGRS